MSVFRMFRQIVITTGVFAAISCGENRDIAEQSYHLTLLSSQAVEFKSDLRDFAKENGFSFVDGSTETKNSRDNINQNSERSSGKNPGLVSRGVEIIDVTVEPHNSESRLLIFAKTSADNEKMVTLTVAHNDNSATERRMVNNFERSFFFRKWIIR
jgi:hypothetical protein